MENQKKEIEALLAEGKTIQIQPIGYSMYPLFVPGRDEAIIAPIREEKLKRGDVVLYRRVESILVLHRIWKCKKDGYYLVGDHQTEIEGPLQREQIKGILVGVVRKGKEFSTKNLCYRFLMGVWLWLRPVRPVISKAVAGCKRIIGKKKYSN